MPLHSIKANNYHENTIRSIGSTEIKSRNANLYTNDTSRCISSERPKSPHISMEEDDFTYGERRWMRMFSCSWGGKYHPTPYRLSNLCISEQISNLNKSGKIMTTSPGSLARFFAQSDFSHRLCLAKRFASLDEEKNLSRHSL